MTATNAPYYQMRGQFITSPNGANATSSQPQHFVSEDDVEYDLSTAPSAVTAHEQSSLYTTDRQNETDAPINTLEENHNLVELLEAATTAAGQAEQAMSTQVGNSTTAGKSKRKRGSSLPLLEDDAAAHGHISSDKRARVHVDPQLQDTESNGHERSESNSVPPGTDSLLNDPRSAGVHSAAALFRRSSDKSARKYTRPPMSKLFMSLQLTPENFLHLQAQAKSYMLDPGHPERQSCVGNRGKGDTDMVKLRLFNCVRDFLNGGAGEQFFGENVEKPGQDEAIEAARALGEDKAPTSASRLSWPRDGNKIISLVTPLLRRMVTNERQRMYAIETRKGGSSKKKDGEDGIGEGDQHGNDGNFMECSDTGQALEQQLQNAFDVANVNMGQTRNAQLSSPIGAAQDPSNLGQAMYSQFSMPAYGSNHDVHSKGSTVDSVPQIEIPTQGPVEPFLERINIFLTTKKHVKLEERRISVQHPTHLMNYPWLSLVNEIHILLKTAMARYPKLREANKSLTPQGMAPEALQGLAVAADALESANADESTRSNPRGSPEITTDKEGEETADPVTLSRVNEGEERTASTTHTTNNAGTHLSPPKTATPGDGLPDYQLRVIGTDGWKTISLPQEWHYALLDHAFASWADGVCTLMVELVDV